MAFLFFLNDQLRISKISVSTLQTADDLNYFSGSNLFVSQFKISGINKCMASVTSLYFPLFSENWKQNLSSWTKSIQIDNLIELQIDK